MRLKLLPLALLSLVVATFAIRPDPPVAHTIEDTIARKHYSDDDEVFVSPSGFFIQEFASKQLPGPGQHFKFGALKPWEEILQLVQSDRNSKLLLLIRHGQALSNALEDKLGPDVWYETESKCNYTDSDGSFYNLFDAELTSLGVEQAQALNSMLKGGGWFKAMTGGEKAHTIVSPLSRCLNTALLALDGLGIEKATVEELVRETLGEDTCDARRSVSDPGEPDLKSKLTGPCSFNEGLRSKFPMFDFPIIDGSSLDRDGGLGGLGMVSDEDVLWTETREKHKHQVRRATTFLYDLFDTVEENVVPIVTHSGTIRSILLAVDREPYRPQNTELVPVIVTRRDD